MDLQQRNLWIYYSVSGVCVSIQYVIKWIIIFLRTSDQVSIVVMAHSWPRFAHVFAIVSACDKWCWHESPALCMFYCLHYWRLAPKQLEKKMHLDVDDCDFSILCFQFDLVCNDEWKQPFSSTVFFIGVLIGAFFGGQIADRYSTHKANSRRIARKTGNVLADTITA